MLATQPEPFKSPEHLPRARETLSAVFRALLYRQIAGRAATNGRISTSELARRAAIDPSALNHWKTGRNHHEVRPPLESVAAVAAAMGLDSTDRSRLMAAADHMPWEWSALLSGAADIIAALQPDPVLSELFESQLALWRKVLELNDDA